ncbi:hypothetical protein AVEN_194374-1 [Araneus ventricosus]|uniref:Uncharacterized protein n=1 Tax=Araneus ventricosus TaxID=182803 RepID=A0A4Y2A799_ARAVE|nr:hypothetical protein AVEN_194374-1 [Araneus ventricosus]
MSDLGWMTSGWTSYSSEAASSITLNMLSLVKLAMKMGLVSPSADVTRKFEEKNTNSDVTGSKLLGTSRNSPYDCPHVASK